MGESIVKRAKHTKVKVFFQGLHTTHVIFVLVYNLVFSILGTPLVVHMLNEHVVLKKNCVKL
jgi:hypothetical protein